MAEKPPADLLRPPDQPQEGRSNVPNKTQQDAISNSPFTIEKSKKEDAIPGAISVEQWSWVQSFICRVNSGAIRVIPSNVDDLASQDLLVFQ